MSDLPGVFGPDRWYPTRAGIINVWRYHEEVFTFHRGRLLLRGRNGTGKSKALELLLPFLLDASLRPNRLSTFGGNERAMYWNMIGHGYRGKTRVGYVWLEFERPTAEGFQHLTLGARLQATHDVSFVKPTYFTSTARVDVDLSLLTPERQPLNVKQLKETVEDAGEGTVHPGPQEYRSAVRSLLYPRLDQARYDALITALLQLRTPKLSERLDPGLLSSLLSSALPPLGHGELADIAGGFERLDQHREQLRDLDREVDAAKSLADHQRVYAARVLRGAAAELITTTGDMGRCGENLRTAQDRAKEAEAQITGLGEREQELEEEFEAVDSELRGLKDSEAYRAGAGIEILRQESARATKVASEREAEAERRRAVAERSGAKSRELATRVERCERGAVGARTKVEGMAQRADLGQMLEEVDRVLAAEGRKGISQVRRLLRAAVSHREGLIHEVEGAWKAHRARLRRREDVETDLGESAEQLITAEEAEATAESTHESQLVDLSEALEEWARGCVELPVGDLEGLVSDIDPEMGVGPHSRVAAARQSAGEELAALHQQARRHIERLRRDRAELAERITLLETATVVDPPVPHTRTADRSGRPGAPLWQLVAFADGVCEVVRAGVEAALESSGLLDAWVLPDGSVLEASGDTCLSAWAHPAPGPSLADVLVVEEEPAVPAEYVYAVLAAISYNTGRAVGAESFTEGRAGPVEVGADGRWRIGHLHGRWSKETPTHIGALARERNRARLIAELTGQITELDRALEGVEEEERAFAERRRRLDAEVSALPSDAQTRRSAQELRSSQELVALRRDGWQRQRERLSEYEPLVVAAEQELLTIAARHRLPVDRQALDSARSALSALGEAVETWLDDRGELFDLAERLEEAQDGTVEAQEEAEHAAVAAETAERTAKERTARLDAMEATEGVEHRQVQERVAHAEARLLELRKELAETRSRQRTLQGRHSELLGDVRVLEERSTTAVSARDEAAERFRGLLNTSLTEDSGLTVPSVDVTTVRGALEAARSVAATSRRADHSPEQISGARAKVAATMHSAGHALAGRTYVELLTEGEVQQVSALLDGVRVGARGLYEALVEEQRVRATDLTTEEYELFDRILTGDTRRHLAERIRRAGGLVKGMNERLGRVRTASQISVRLRWEVSSDAPSGTEQARELLLHHPGQLSDDEREVLYAFLRERIDDARTEDTAAGWEEHLAQVLDYTSWHRFTVELDRDDGRGWQILTRREHGGLSGGEKAIALHLPLFAAVAAHYAADPGAPRFILLDEVFVGVDTANRGQIFALLVDLGLDLVLTSDHEWCTYAELDGIAVHQLIPADPDDSEDGVVTARWVWTGTTLEESDKAWETEPGPEAALEGGAR